MDVSLSTVTALKLGPTPFESRACNAFGAIAASVKTKESIVAMSGAIMPAPLAMPEMVTGNPSIFALRVATLGKVSVVMMALAASRKAVALTRPAQSASTPSNFVASSGSPITPVEASATSSGLQPRAFAAIFAVSATASRPLRPVKALALPELTTSPCARPPARIERHQSTGAEGHFERVKTPAMAVPFSRRASSTSVRPL